MSEGKMSVFYIVATIMLLLSLSLFMNGNVSAASYDSARSSVSTGLAAILLPGEHHMGDTLYDVFCYTHNQYFGLRS